MARFGYLRAEDVAEDTGTAAVAGRDVGVANATDLVDRQAADGRYAQIGTPLQVGSYTVSSLPPPTSPARIIYVSDETGGAVLAFSDGTNWRRVTDRAIVA